MNKQNLGNELKAQLIMGYDITKISRWASHIYFNEFSLNSELSDLLETLLSMEVDPQFEITKDELDELANKLITEGEKEELGQPILEIKDNAQSIDDDWVMCPLCQEAWLNFSKYAMLRCPKCNSKLHNPKFKDLS